MPRTPDTTLKSPEFKMQLQHAEEWARAQKTDVWAVRIVWISLVYGVLGARRYAQRRANYQSSQVWLYYMNLLRFGVISEEPEGVIWDKGAEPWDSDPMLWLTTLVHIAMGTEPPEGFPCIRGGE